MRMRPLVDGERKRMIAPKTCRLGETMTFCGYADDYGRPISAVEFSLDGGDTWALLDVSAAKPGLSVQWEYSYTPKRLGRYQLMVRSVSPDGRRSPTNAVVEFFVEA